MAMTFNYFSKNHIVLKLALVFASIISTSTIDGAAPLQNDMGQCTVRRCRSGPPIRFPFHLKYEDKHKHDELHPHESCVFPGFQLSCNTSGPFDFPEFEYNYQVNTSLPGLYLAFSVKAEVRSIDYKLRQLEFSPTTTQITQKYASSSAPATATVSSTFKPLTLSQKTGRNRICPETYYSCPPRTNVWNYGEKIHSLSGDGFVVRAVDSRYTTAMTLMTSCTKMYNISDAPNLPGDRILTWSGPDCDDCEAKGEYCKLKLNSTAITECYPIPRGPSSHKLLIAGKVGGTIFLSLIVVALCYAIHSYKQNKNYQLRIETFLEDYKALKPTRYSCADIKKISHQFKFKLGQGGYGSVFKGQLSSDVVVAVKVLHDTAHSKGSGEDFINEVSTIGLIHHINVVRLVGYCADGCRRALVYEFLPNNSLEKFVYSRENHDNGFLGWEKMQEIALGIAKGIEYVCIEFDDIFY